MHNPAASLSEPTQLRSSLAQRLRWPGLAAFVGVFWAGCATGESLWLDELHSSWSVSGSWSDVAARAGQGNQSPLFFYCVFGLVRTLGNLGGMPGELLLRLPSVVCWGLTLFVCLWIVAQGRSCLPSPGETQLKRRPLKPRPFKQRPRKWGQTLNARLLGSDPRPAMGVALVLWLLLDRIQLFYATEARVYAMVQLISLLGWCCIYYLASKDNLQTVGRIIFLWCGLSVLLISLHLTAALACAWQIACGTWILYNCQSRTNMARLQVLWAAAVAMVLMALGVAWQLSLQVWEHRQQWASFAGDASWSALVGLFPLAAYLVPVATARGVDWLCSIGQFVRPLGQRRAHRQTARGPLSVRFNKPPDAPGPLKSHAAQWLWWIAAAGPWLSAWCVTSLGIAPVFHRRFVIVAAIPLVLIAIGQLALIRRPALRWLAVLGVAAWLAISQGTLDNWRSGAWYGWQRAEGWRQASLFVQSQVKRGETVWCYSGLIEASGAELPLTDSLDQYLSFPLRGLYQLVDAQGAPLAPRALIGDGASWRGQLLAAAEHEYGTAQAEQSRAGGGAAEQFVGAELVAGNPNQWIVYRGSPSSFRRQLRLLQRASAEAHLENWQIDAPRSFGSVSVVRMSAGYRR